MKTKNEEPTNETIVALMSNNIGYIQSDIKDIKQSIKELTGVFATKTELVEVAKIQTDHETRIRDGEKALWRYVGVFSVISVMISILVPIIVKDFFK